MFPLLVIIMTAWTPHPDRIVFNTPIEIVETVRIEVANVLQQLGIISGAGPPVKVGRTFQSIEAGIFLGPPFWAV